MDKDQKREIGEKVIKSLNFSIKSIDEENRTFEAVASDETQDRYGEVIKLDGWELDNFKKNPVVPWGHNYSQPPVAQALEIGYKDGQLVFRPKFATADEYSFADTIWKLYKGGYLRAFSVGLRVLAWSDDFMTILKAELLEVSAVTVPANPNALVLAADEGVISHKEARVLIKKLDAQSAALAKSLTDDNHNQDNEDMNAEVLETIKANTQATSELAAGVTALVSKLTKSDDEPVIEQPKLDGDEAPVIDPENPDAPEDATTDDDGKNGDEPDDAPANPSADEPDGGADDADEEIDPDNLTEDQAERIAAGIKAGVEKELGRVE